MARNPIRFQKGISLNEFLSPNGTEDQCFDALYQWRWPNGLFCPIAHRIQTGDIISKLSDSRAIDSIQDDICSCIQGNQSRVLQVNAIPNSPPTNGRADSGQLCSRKMIR